MKHELTQLTEKAEHYFGSDLNIFARKRLAAGIIQLILNTDYIGHEQKRRLVEDSGYVKRAVLARRLGVSRFIFMSKIEKGEIKLSQVDYKKSTYYQIDL